MTQFKAAVKNNINTIQRAVNRAAAGRTVTILGATKYCSPTETAQAIEAGLTLIGENYVQSAETKWPLLMTSTLPPHHRHLIGPLQSNKVKKAIGLFDCIQSLDRLSILEKVNSECGSGTTKLPVMLQINAGQEPNKSGFFWEEILRNEEKLFSFPNITIVGIMAVTPFSTNTEDVRPLFKACFNLFSTLKSNHSSVHILSMGMSNDYVIAVEEGSTMIRVGSVLFGH